MSGDTIIHVPSSTGDAWPYVIQITSARQDWSDLAIYAPALPGLIVAFLGLWIAHHLTRRRERRKEIFESCAALKEALEGFQQACESAWLSIRGEERSKAVHDVKSRLQSLGMMATDLSRRSTQGKVCALIALFCDYPMSVNVKNDIAALRDIATADPFEDPRRPSDDSVLFDIRAQVGVIDARMHELAHRLYG